MPEWYLEAGRPQNETVSVANSELKAILNGLGDLAQNLDPNVETMRQDYGDRLTERKIRLLSSYQFDRLNVSTQVEYYREINYRDETRTLQQKLVRARFPFGDTTAKITYYLEENRADVSSVCRIKPDTKALANPPEVLDEVIEENGIRRKKFAEMNGRYFVLLSYR